MSCEIRHIVNAIRIISEENCLSRGKDLQHFLVVGNCFR